MPNDERDTQGGDELELGTEAVGAEGDGAGGMEGAGAGSDLEQEGESEIGQPEGAESGALPAEFSGLALVAEDAGYTGADIAAMIREVGPANTKKFLQRLQQRFMSGFEGDEQGPIDAFGGGNGLPGQQQDGAGQGQQRGQGSQPGAVPEFALPPELAKVFIDAAGGDENFIKNGIGPFAGAINKYTEARVEAAVAKLREELTGHIRPVLDGFQRQQHAEAMRNVESFMAPLIKQGFGKIYGQNGSRTPIQDATFNRFLQYAAQAANKMKASGKRVDPNQALRYAHFKITNGELPMPAAVQQVQSRITRRAQQITVAPSGGAGVRPAKTLSREQRLEKKAAKVREVMERSGGSGRRSRR